MLKVVEQYCSGPQAVAKFLTVYIEEAHATDRWALPNSVASTSGDGMIRHHRDLTERLEAAKIFENVVKRENSSRCTFDVVVDSMSDDMTIRYDGVPERLYVVQDGVIVYKGGPGPFGYHIHEIQEFLIEQFGIRGERISEDY